MFPRLPPEVQRQIFKCLLPKAREYHIKFTFCEDPALLPPSMLPEDRTHTTLSVFIYNHKPEAFDDLLTLCRSAGSVIVDSYEKIEITSIGRTKIETLEDFAYAEKWSESDIVRNPDRGNDARMFMRMRPQEDIIIINAEDLLIFYHYGGTIDMSKITKLCLYDTPWQNEPSVRNFHMSFPEDKILDHLRKHCPALKELYISFPGVRTWPLGTYSNRLVLWNPEVPGRFEHFDYVDRDGREISRIPESHFERCDKAHKKQERMISEALAKQLSLPEREEWLDESTREELTAKKQFWEKVDIIPACVHFLPSTKAWDGYPENQRRLLMGVQSWHSYIPCHSDGSLIHRYKGLEQLFEGAPW
jgi:hypothetical protein